jgi:hypothetical protein
MASVSEFVHAVTPAIRRHKNRVYGFAPGLVIAVWDPKNEARHKQGYVQVYFPGMQLEGDHVDSSRSDPEKGTSALRDHDPLIAPWARLAPVELGIYSTPQLGDEVLCAFEHGDPHYPYVVGTLYNGKDAIPKPVSNPDAEGSRPQGCPATPDMSGDGMSGSGGGSNKVMFWRSRTGNVISLNDATGQMRMADRSGCSTFQLNGDKIEILQSAKDIRISAKNKVSFDCKDFIVNAKKNITKNTTTYNARAGADFAQSAQATLSMVSKGSFKANSGKDWTAFSEDKVEVKAKGGSVTFIVNGDLGIVAPEGDLAIESKGAFSALTPMKFAMGCAQDMKVKGDGAVNINAALKLTFKGQNCLVNCGADAGFSLFDAIWNGLKKVTAMVVKGAVGAFKAVAGAVVAGATALGRAALAGPAALAALAVSAAKGVVRLGQKVVTKAWDVTRDVGKGMVKLGKAAVDSTKKTWNRGKTVAGAAWEGGKDVASTYGPTMAAGALAGAPLGPAGMVAGATLATQGTVGANVAASENQINQSINQEMQRMNLSDSAAGNDAIQSVNQAMSPQSGGPSSAGHVARGGVRAVNTATRGLSSAGQKGSRLMSRGVTTMGRGMMAGSGMGVLMGGRSVNSASKLMKNAGSALISTNNSATQSLLRASNAKVMGATGNPLDEAALELIATVNRGNRIIAEVTGNTYQEGLEAIMQQSHEAIRQVAQIVGSPTSGGATVGGVAVDMSEASVPVAEIAQPAGLDAGAPVSGVQGPAAPYTPPQEALVAPTSLRGRMVPNVNPGMRDKSGKLMPLPNPAQIAQVSAMGEMRQF